METTPEIGVPEFYKDKTIFITGGSGFIGKVLIEKLLRSCPGVKKIYLLMRPKKGLTATERIKKITDLPLFDLLREQNPSAFDKLRLITGDSSQLRLGMSESDRAVLIDEVDIVFHGAASVRFDDPLKDSILLNTRGTRELVEMSLEMKQLKVFVHISTTYCNTDRKVIGEQLYPAHADWRKTIEIVEKADKRQLDVLTSKYISPFPNTYTFAKSLAEHVVYDLANGKIPIVIFRPSIVISSFLEPMPGWTDNFNGPVGLLVAAGKGIVRSIYTDPDIIADYVPVDLVVKAMILSAWVKGLTKDQGDRLEATFYNGSKNNERPITMGQIVEMGKVLREEVPVNNVLWYPNGRITKCYYAHFLKVIFYHILPAIIIDALLKLSGHKPMLLKVQRRIYVANKALSYFLRNQWVFLNDKTRKLEQLLSKEDYHDFGYRGDELGTFEFFRNGCIGGRRYLLKEDDSTLDQAKRHTRRMWVLYHIVNFLWYLLFFWILFVKFDILSIVSNRLQRAYIYFTTD